jgi:serine/threonine protein kinase
MIYKLLAVRTATKPVPSRPAPPPPALALPKVTDLENLSKALLPNSDHPLSLGGGNRYTVGALIGKGSFAEVYLGRHDTTGRLVALKADRSRDAVTLNLEFKILSRLRNKNIIALIDYGRFGNSGSPSKVILALEYAQDGTLYSYCLNEKTRIMAPKDLLSTTLQVFSIDLLRGLRYLEKKGIVHQDLKPENILLVRQRSDEPPLLKIGDFGNAIALPKGKMYPCTIRCSRFYRSPEEAFGTWGDHKVDTWAFGAIMYELMTGHPLIAKRYDKEHAIAIHNLLGPAPPKFITQAKMESEIFKSKSSHTLQTRLTEPDIVKHDTVLQRLLGSALQYPDQRLNAADLRKLMKSVPK